MKNLLITVSSLLVLSSCQNQEPLTSEEILAQSIAYHDPGSKWSNLNTKFEIESQSVFNDNNKDTIELRFDILKDKFGYNNYRTNEVVSFEGANCYAHSMKGLCESKGWTKNFYTYIWGLPMKLKDEGTVLSSIVVDTLFFEKPCYALSVKYEAESWLYFINKESSKLEGFQFIFNNDNEKGEYVRNIGNSDMSGVDVPMKRIWYDLKGKELGTDVVVP